MERFSKEYCPTEQFTGRIYPGLSQTQTLNFKNEAYLKLLCLVGRWLAPIVTKELDAYVRDEFLVEILKTLLNIRHMLGSKEP